MIWEDVIGHLDQAWLLLNILLSGVLGFAIGFERKLRNKEAGIRTHTIVCLGSALLTAVSIWGFGPASDGARVAAQIVSGVGFLGAGIIVYRKHEVRGLTTAAGVWATAGVGMACGASMYILACGATVILIAMQCFLHANIRPFRLKKTYSINISFLQSDDNNLEVKRLFGTDRFNRLTIDRVGDEVHYTAMLQTDQELSSADLDTIMRENPYILSIERCDNA